MKVAYFCAEFALESKMPSYAGGLGVLAGDYILQAADSDFPITGVGLYYKKGQNANLQSRRPSDFNLKIVRESFFKKLLIKIPLGESHIFAQVWQWKNKKVSVYFLDTDVLENSLADRRITEELYVENRELRLKQEIVLGLGGAILLETLKIAPDLYHLNEGHSAFLSLFLLKKEIINNFDWQKVINKIKTKVVFTNHTLVLEGQEIFTKNNLRAHTERFCQDANINFEKFFALGTNSPTDNLFSMTTLALNTAGLSNAVSKIHGEKARELWPNWPIVHITNGIYLPRWDKIGNQEIVKAHDKNEDILLKEIRKIRGRKWKKDGLLVGWSRRFVPYKRPLALVEDIKRLKQIADFFNGKIHIVYSAPLGEDAVKHNEYLQQLFKLMGDGLNDLITFLPNYRIDLAEKLVAGCDIWLNTPIVGREACGTSGMKAALNGTLAVSTNDGWINEVNLYENGWLIDDQNVTESLMEKLEKEILPAYIKYDLWPNYMRNSRRLVLEKFSTERMLKEYIHKLYEPVKNKQNNES